MATAKTKRFGVYLSEDGLSALNSIIALQQLNPDRDKSLVIDKALLFITVISPDNLIWIIFAVHSEKK